MERAQQIVKIHATINSVSFYIWNLAAKQECRHRTESPGKRLFKVIHFKIDFKNTHLRFKSIKLLTSNTVWWKFDGINLKKSNRIEGESKQETDRCHCCRRKCSSAKHQKRSIVYLDGLRENGISLRNDVKYPSNCLEQLIADLTARPCEN